MKHRFLSKLPIYQESPCCGYVDEELLENKVCKRCGETINEVYCWFPDSAYEYVVLLVQTFVIAPLVIQNSTFPDIRMIPGVFPAKAGIHELAA